MLFESQETKDYFAVKTSKSITELKSIAAMRATAKQIDPMLTEYVLRIGDKNIEKLVTYSLKPKGLRERPYLVRLACESVGGDFTEILHAATAVELLHFSTLVIDDIFDESPKRGSIATVYSKYGRNYAIIAAEILRSLAMSALLDSCMSHKKGDLYLIKVLFDIFEETYRDVYIGQHLDLYFETQRKVSEKEYLIMICKTTGSLIKASLLTGAILGGANDNEITSLDNYGECLGYAFQIRDDVIELISQEEIIGKKIGGDVYRQKKRLPIIYFLHKTKDSKRKRKFRRLMEQLDEHNEFINEIIELLAKAGALEYCKQKINKFCDKAISVIVNSNFKNKKATTLLMEFAELLRL